jgi:pimeloyl-ACP methyl ester carboxylesterase
LKRKLMIRTLFLTLLCLLQPLVFAQTTTFTEGFNNAPDYTNNWRQFTNYGGTTLNYTTGNFQISASQSSPYPPGSAMSFMSKQAWVGDIDVSVQLNHGGYGRTSVYLWSRNLNQPVMGADLDTDDTNYFNFASGPNSTQYLFSSTPYRNTWITLRVQVVGNQVNFYADNGSGLQLLETFPVPVSSLPDAYYLFFAVGSVPWKSGDNNTSFRLITATGTHAPFAYNAVNDFSITANPNKAWSYGYSNTLGGTFTPHNTAQIDYQPGINQPGVDRWTSPTVQGSLGVMHNKTASTIQASTYTIPVDMLAMHPGWTGQTGIYEVVRWVAPQSGNYAVQGVFAGLDVITSVAATEVHVLLNSATELIPVTILHGTASQPATFSLDAQLHAGDTLDFVVGIGNIATGNSNDSTGLKAIITPTTAATGTITIDSAPQALPATFSITPSIAGAPTGGPYPLTLHNVPPGSYTVTFNPITGYIVQQPSPQTQSLAAGGSISFTGTYMLATGSISMTSTPPGAGFKLQGPGLTNYNGTAPATIPAAPLGLYTITWQTIRGYEQVPVETKQLTAGLPIPLPFTATYYASKPITIIVPGALGSKLAAGTQTVWLTNRAIETRGGFPDLKYDTNGNPTASLTPQGQFGDLLNLFENQGTSSSLTCTGGLLALYDALPGPSAQDRCHSYVYTYNYLRDSLAAQGYDPQTFPYDWRMDLGDLSTQLLQVVLKVADLQPTRRIALIGHSMGGLVIQEGLRRYPSQLIPLLGPIVTLGTPFNGSLKSYMDFEAWDSVADFIGRLASQDLMANWTSAYELLPRYDFLEFRGQVAHYQDLYAGSFFQTSLGSLFPALPRQPVLPLVYSLWAHSSPAAPYPQAYAIIGSGMATPVHLSDRLKSDCMTAEKGSGDQTVPLESAQAVGWIPQSNFRYVKEEHVLLPSNPAVVNGILNIVSNKPDALPNQAYTLDTTLEAVACSPIDISITNNAGQQTSVGARQITSGQYYNVGGSTQIWVPALPPTDTVGKMIVQLRGLDLGTFTLILRETTETVALSEIRFVDLPVSDRSTGYLAVSHVTGAVVLNLDVEGDGIVDFIIRPNQQPEADVSISILAAIVRSLPIDPGVRNSLAVKLNEAAAGAGRGDNHAAQGGLNAFLNEVTAQTGKSISPETAQRLSSICQTLLAVLAG